MPEDCTPIPIHDLARGMVIKVGRFYETVQKLCTVDDTTMLNTVNATGEILYRAVNEDDLVLVHRPTPRRGFLKIPRLSRH